LGRERASDSFGSCPTGSSPLRHARERPRYTTRKKDGKVHRSWRLVRSVRIGGRVIQQTVTHLGELDEAGRLRARALARTLIGAPEQADLFDGGTRDQTIGVRLKGVRVENGRHLGISRPARKKCRGRRWPQCWS
jgi:hypothetical protein